MTMNAMYKLSVPLNIDLLNDESKAAYANDLKACGAERVFLFCAEAFTRKNCYLYSNPERIEQAIRYFKEAGFEVGVWMDGFGHGDILAHATPSEYVGNFTRIRGSDGREAQEGFCPLDEEFRACFASAVRIVAKMAPDLIMFDDDFRLNIRKYNLGCCCERHMRLLCERLGKNIAYDEVERLAFCGAENEYRSAFMDIMGETLLDFCRLLRKTVDEINPSIRMSCCAVYSTWDFEGTDMIAIAKTLAGKTKPFLRTIGAPYHGPRIQYAVEHTRMQSSWCEKEGIELIAEGDVYPRPRYAVPSRYLEAFDLAVIASGATDGILKYMLDYNRPHDYERGYLERHIRNAPLRGSLAEIFRGKHPIGVRVFEAMHKIKSAAFPEKYEKGIAVKAWNSYFSIAQKLLSENAIPSVYTSNETYPVIVFGENARSIPESELKNGAILDAVAAKILSDRGINTGIAACEAADFVGERFPENGDLIRGLDGICMQRMLVSDRVEIKSVFAPGDLPASYRYENAQGQRFFVLSIDAYRSNKNSLNYFNNYYRQRDLVQAVPWLCGKVLPAICEKHPFLYMQAAENEDKTKRAFALFNMNIDEIVSPIISLDREYSSIKTVGCEARLEGSTVRIVGDVAPYGMAAFELTV